jgi:hypothetical protein
MSKAERTTNNVEPFFHAISHYDSPDDVLNDAKLSTDEKRVILSSWASDMYVVESRPTLREIPGLPHRLRLDDILSALKQLDDETDPPPRGGMAMRLPALGMVDGADCEEPQNRTHRQALTGLHRSVGGFGRSSHRRWTREENIRRYRKLLNTQLTGLERSFIERRLAEELRG